MSAERLEPQQPANPEPDDPYAVREGESTWDRHQRLMDAAMPRPSQPQRLLIAALFAAAFVAAAYFSGASRDPEQLALVGVLGFVAIWIGIQMKLGLSGHAYFYVTSAIVLALFAAGAMSFQDAFPTILAVGAIAILFVLALAYVILTDRDPAKP